MDHIDQSIINIYDLLPHTFTVLGPFISSYAIAKLIEEFDERFTEMDRLKIKDNIIEMAITDGFTVLPEKQFQELFAILADWAVLNNYAEIKEADQELPAPDPLGGNAPPNPCDGEAQINNMSLDPCIL